MPDFNPKNIPTLNDVIDDGLTDNDKKEAEKHDSNPDNSEAQQGDSNDKQGKLAEAPDILSSAEEVQHIVNTILSEPDNNRTFARQPPIDIPPDHSTSLQATVNSIVEQMMPQLEQQLKQLVRQNLEDKLPDDILKALHSADEQTL